ncbi:killer cell lectin-like receptor subfamily H, member 1 isoform 1 [Mus musculus]|uniref:Killer cell lectin-like receptor H1 n=2 Tax=Mus musculus TaxID=10090 RepID=Q58A37_MOUSE|nr:killer cell lectin-like receptor subfamily H, member 1 isoform 1 [Mus musculus]BAD93356.1 killer cell lectin-like receptor H1 [Mus musculus]|eukprot:NP_001014997.1 killer cell lectin-like receptor subfamily H, member 1 isoform 1 [Mus musculus]
MNDERPTYAQLKLSKKSKDKKQSTQKKKEYPWRISVVILGTVCLCLLISSTVFGYWFFQATSNFKIQYEKDKNESAVSSMEVVHSSGLLLTAARKGCYTCQGGWSCCGGKCYFFSEEEKTWDESEASCKVLGSLLAKIDSREEQNFIQSQVNYSYWVGLHKKGSQFQWVHHKDAKLSSDLDFHTATHVADAECGYIKPKNLNVAPCHRYFYYICKRNFTCPMT